MLTLQRRHSPKCPDRNKGPNHLKCRGRCLLRACGTADDGRRVRLSLKTRDLQRATRRLIEMEDRGSERLRKTIADAVDAFLVQHDGNADDTKRKYKRILRCLTEFCSNRALQYVDEVGVEAMDGYPAWRNKRGSTWNKDVELLRQFFDFCRDREWTSKNPANSLERDPIQDNDIVPYTQKEIVQIIVSCNDIGRHNYERRRARAMVLLMRFAGLRISDVVTLEREHVKGSRIEKRAVKNKKWIRVEVPPAVIEALELLPQPKAAAMGNGRFFYSDAIGLRSLVKGAWRTLDAVFKRSGVAGAKPHRFRHTLASELLGKGGTFEEIAAILADSPYTIRRYYAKWTPEYQSRQDTLIRKIHGTDLAQA